MKSNITPGFILFGLGLVGALLSPLSLIFLPFKLFSLVLSITALTCSCGSMIIQIEGGENK